MVNKSSLAKKLTSYSALATVVLAVGYKADGQIIYTKLDTEEIIPSQIVSVYDTSHTYEGYLDLNNDGISDFKFVDNVQDYIIPNSGDYGDPTIITGSWIGGYGLNNDKLDADTADNYAKLIGNKNNWKASQELAFLYYKVNFSHSYHYRSGAFYNTSDKYLPLKLMNKGKIYYGWARISITSYGLTLIIKEYAYNSIPDSSIEAGNTGCSVAPVSPIITLSGDTLHSTTANKYQWFLGDSLLANDTSGFIIPVDTGYYTVLTTDSNGCLSQSTVMYDTVVNISTGVSPFILTYDDYIYSYNKLLHVIIYDNKLLGSNVFIYNIMGQLVFSAKLTSAQTEIDMADFTAGVYVVKVSGNVSSIVKKIIVE